MQTLILSLWLVLIYTLSLPKLSEAIIINSKKKKLKNFKKNFKKLSKKEDDIKYKLKLQADKIFHLLDPLNQLRCNYIINKNSKFITYNNYEKLKLIAELCNPIGLKILQGKPSFPYQRFLNTLVIARELNGSLTPQ